MLIKWLKCLKQGTFSQQIQENQTNTLNLSAPELSSWAIPLPKCTHCASFCHLLQIIIQLQCTPAGYWPGGFKLVLSPCCGIWSWVYDQDFKLRTPELSMIHLGRNFHMGGQNRCKATFAEGGHVSVCFTPGIIMCIQKHFWLLLEKSRGRSFACCLFSLVNFWSLNIQVKTTAPRCYRRGNSSEAVKWPSSEPLTQDSSCMHWLVVLQWSRWLEQAVPSREPQCSPRNMFS